jgi:hypothetical protein
LELIVGRLHGRDASCHCTFAGHDGQRRGEIRGEVEVGRSWESSGGMWEVELICV